LAGAVLLALTTPLRRSGRDEDGGGGSSQQGSSSVGQHVVMLHNRTIWIANGSRVEDDAIDRGGGGGSSAGRLIATLRMMSACDTRRSRYGGGEGFQGCVGVWEELVGAI